MRHPITEQPIVYKIPSMEEVIVQRDIEYAGGRTLDVYVPPDGENLPAVLFVTGFRDAGFEARLGCKMKEMASYVTWARLAAASGFAAVTYTNADPAEDALTVIRYIRENAASLRIDGDRIAVWSCSGNVPNALALIMEEPVTCAVVCYGFMLDLDGRTSVADAQTQWGFANPAAGKSVDDVPPDLPLLIVRAGRDEMAGLNPSIDRFVAHALARNLPVTLINHATGPHSFDLFDDTDSTRSVIRQIVAFIHLRTSV
jgi:acetyl esterase/lipase